MQRIETSLGLVPPHNGITLMNNNTYQPLALTRITDNRCSWREQYESHLRNTAEAAASEYYKDFPRKVDYTFGNLWQAIAFAVFMLVSIYMIAAYLNSQH